VVAFATQWGAIAALIGRRPLANAAQSVHKFGVNLTAVLLASAAAAQQPAPTPDTPFLDDSPDIQIDAAGQEEVKDISDAIQEEAPEPTTVDAGGKKEGRSKVRSADAIPINVTTSRTEDLINSLPFAFAAQGANVNLGATGTANVNLSGLGPQRTLVAINGRRLHPGDPRDPVPDLNFVPRIMIKRFDYLTGGASSVYGSDAVAGVVNFIMDTNFQGLRIDLQGSTLVHNNSAKNGVLDANAALGSRPPHGVSVNGGVQDIAAEFGVLFDDKRGSITAYATYHKQDAVLRASRDYSFCPLAARAAPSRDFDCNGSTISAPGTFVTNVGTFQVQGDEFVPGVTQFNAAPYDFLQRPDERYTFGGFAEYQVTRGAKAYLEAMFMNDRTHSQIAPSGDFFNTTSINCDNPLLSTQQVNTICVPNNTFVDGLGVTRAIAEVGRRNVEGGAREDHLEHNSWRLVGGIRGEVLKGVWYDAYYQFGTTRLSQAYLNDFSATRLARALDVVANPAIGGVTGVAVDTPVCRAALPGSGPGGGALDANCVPYNIFQAGGVAAAALNYLQIPLLARGHVSETVADANVTLDGTKYGLRTPWSDRGVGINVGGEYRKESLDFQSDNAFQTGDGVGQDGPVLPARGDYDVREAFAEVQVPIVSQSFVKEFTLSASYRYSDFKVANRHSNADSYRLSAELAPIDDIRFRTNYNRAIRAANVVELFTSQRVALGGAVDPCAGPAVAGLVNGLTAAQCASTGVTAGQFGNIAPNPASQYNALSGGNTHLLPEKADTFTAGVVLQPRWIPGLALAIDYFDLKVRNAIGSIGFETIMNQCLSSGDPFFCSKIHRAPGSGSMWMSQQGFADTTKTNVGGVRTKGVDFNGSYSRSIGRIGTLNVSYVSTILSKLEVETVNGGSANQDGKFDCAGLYGNGCGAFLTGAPSPKYRHRLRIAFALPIGIGISSQWRYFSSVKNDGTERDCDLNPTPTCTGNVAPANRTIRAQSYFDLALIARIADRYNFRLGANNILDKQPPIVGTEVAKAPFGNGNTFPQLYDALGRYVFAGLTIDF